MIELLLTARREHVRRVLKLEDRDLATMAAGNRLGFMVVIDRRHPPESLAACECAKPHLRAGSSEVVENLIAGRLIIINTIPRMGMRPETGETFDLGILTEREARATVEELAGG